MMGNASAAASTMRPTALGDRRPLSARRSRQFSGTLRDSTDALNTNRGHPRWSSVTPRRARATDAPRARARFDRVDHQGAQRGGATSIFDRGPIHDIRDPRLDGRLGLHAEGFVDGRAQGLLQILLGRGGDAERALRRARVARGATRRASRLSGLDPRVRRRHVRARARWSRPARRGATTRATGRERRGQKCTSRFECGCARARMAALGTDRDERRARHVVTRYSVAIELNITEDWHKF